MTSKAKTKAAKVTTKAKATPKGLVLSAAQRKAYSTAYSAAASAARNKIAFRAASNRYRAFRLASAHGLMKAAAAARGSAQAAAIAANAARMSRVQSTLGHQNAALQARIEHDMFTHESISGRLQYAAAGERALARRAIAQTVDQSQANAHERQVFNAINKTAKKASRSTINTGKKTQLSKSQSAAIAKAGNTAGLKAAARVKSATVRTAARHGPALAFATEWMGDEDEPCCVVFAVANHLLYSKGATGLRLYDDDIAELTALAGSEPTIEGTLWQAWLTGWPKGRHVHLANYRRVPDDMIRRNLPLRHLVVGYETEFGDHAALSLPDGRVVSWGSAERLRAAVEEAWALTWES